jgi:predicted nuclease of restriction endonuclease-like RecB superfamily
LLTADLVHVRRRADQLLVVPLSPDERARALTLADAYLALAKAHVGATRGALQEACKGVVLGARDLRLGKGLHKLVLDRCTFEEGAGLDPGELRQALFLRAAEARRAGVLDRQALLAAVAEERGATPEALEAALYADLPDAHVLQSFDALSPAALVATYEAAQVQAVLLKAVKVTAVVRGSPAAYRFLFRRLKFLRLLHRIERLPDGKKGKSQAGYCIEIDGPFALFESVTKYGLQLALAFPALAACDAWSLEAQVRWGKDARPLRFLVRGEGGAAEGIESSLPDEVAALLAQLREAGSRWKARVSDAVLELPGVGLCVPDLELSRAGKTVYLEVMGFWSRDAVWKRIELVERGLPHRLVFAVSKHLRVSEEALDDKASAALYVYSRTMNAKAVLERVERAAL